MPNTKNGQVFCCGRKIGIKKNNKTRKEDEN